MSNNESVPIHEGAWSVHDTLGNPVCIFAYLFSLSSYDMDSRISRQLFFVTSEFAWIHYIDIIIVIHRDIQFVVMSLIIMQVCP